MELYTLHGFEQTTVAEISGRAGLTERTFFRHFADKREVLFRGAGTLQELIVSAVLNAPASESPVQAVVTGLEVAGAYFQGSPERARTRWNIINANPELQARELSKLAALGAAVADSLQQRGVPEAAAGLAAESGVVVFRTAFERWIAGTGEKDWSQLVHESLCELRAVLAAG